MIGLNGIKNKKDTLNILFEIILNKIENFKIRRNN